MKDINITDIAAAAGFHRDKYGLYWDNDTNSEGVDLEAFAEILIHKCADIISAQKFKDDKLNNYQIAHNKALQRCLDDIRNHFS